MMGWLERNARWVLPTPAFLALSLLLIFPIAYTVWVSLLQWQVSSVRPAEFVGLRNYTDLFTDDPRFWKAVLRTFYIGGLAVLVETVLGVAMALAFNRHFWGRGLLRTLAILPMVATPAAMALIFALMYHPTLGVLNYFVQGLGMRPFKWTYDAASVVPSLVLVDAWQWTSLIMLIVLAGLATLPQDPYEAALIDGASAWQTFWLITMPLLRPTLAVAILFRLIDALKMFDIIFVMTQGGPGDASETLNLYLFNLAFSYFKVGYASSLVVVFFALILGVSLVVIKLRRADA